MERNEFGKIVDGHRIFQIAVPIVPEDDARCIHVVHDAVFFGDNGHPRILAHNALDTRSHQRRLGREQGNRLPLHVRTHQCPVGVIVFQKGNQGGGHTDELVRRYVHQLDILALGHHELSLDTGCDQRVHVLVVFVQRCIGLGNGVFFFLESAEEPHLVGNRGILDSAVRCFDKSVFIHPGISAQGNDQSDVGPFRCFDGTDPAVMGGVNIPDFKSGPLPGQPAGPRALSLLLWVVSESGLVWSMNWDNWLVPKNSLTTAVTGLGLTRSWGIRASTS